VSASVTQGGHNKEEKTTQSTAIQLLL